MMTEEPKSAWQLVELVTGESYDAYPPSWADERGSHLVKLFPESERNFRREHLELRGQDTGTRQRITLLEAELAALQASPPYQRAGAILSLPRAGHGDDQRREMMEEEL